jgi:hypothetical protein
MDKIKNIVIQIEKFKINQQFKDAIKLIESSLIKYNNDYRLYEELTDVYLYK